MTKIFYTFIKKEQSHKFLQHILKEYYGIEKQILIDENGKPYIDGNDVYFNISHSNDLLMIAVSSLPVGIDVEYVTPRDYKKLAQRFFTDEENQKVNSLLSFYVLWTKKESFLKYLGYGISKTDKIAFEQNTPVFGGVARQEYSISEKFDDYIFTLTSPKEQYEKILLM